MSVAALKKMAEAGLTLEQAIEIMEAMGGGQRSRGAERQARYRERRAESTGGVTRDVTGDVTGDASPTPCPLPSSPQTPQQPTPTPEKTTRPRKGAAPKAYPDEFEAVWRIYPHAEGRSSKPETLAQWLALTDDDRLALPVACARYRREGREPKADCGAPAMERWLRRGLHQNWAAQPTAELPTGPVDPAVTARRLTRFRDTGVWEPGWGPKPNDFGPETAPDLAEQRQTER